MTLQRFLSLAIFTMAVFAAPSLAHANATNAPGADALSGLTPMQAGALEDYAGGSGLVNDSLATVNSSITGNTIGDVGFTGGVFGNSLTGNSGLSTLIANSGNQVSISQSTVVNVFLH